MNILFQIRFMLPDRPFAHGYVGWAGDQMTVLDNENLSPIIQLDTKDWLKIADAIKALQERSEP